MPTENFNRKCHTNSNSLGTDHSEIVVPPVLQPAQYECYDPKSRTPVTIADPMEAHYGRITRMRIHT